jgi:hypothetical protein
MGIQGRRVLVVASLLSWHVLVGAGCTIDPLPRRSDAAPKSGDGGQTTDLGAVSAGETSPSDAFAERTMKDIRAGSTDGTAANAQDLDGPLGKDARPIETAIFNPDGLIDQAIATDLDEDHPVEERNGCGGSVALLHAVNEACQCGGTWKCDGTDAVRCSGSSLNECGGCGVLSGAKGDACDCGGTLACDSPDRLVCVGATAAPQDPCGGCKHGHNQCTNGKWDCVGDDTPANFGQACGCQGRGTILCDGSCSASAGQGCTPAKIRSVDCESSGGGSRTEKCDSNCMWKPNTGCPCDNNKCAAESTCDGRSGSANCICKSCASTSICCGNNGVCYSIPEFPQGCPGS